MGQNTGASRFVGFGSEEIMRYLLIALAISCSVAVTQAADAAKPNIVIIMADDLGYGDVGWHGGPYKTPNLDKLAKASVRLESHYSLPVCSPTRSALLSGRFNSRFGCTNPTNDRVFPFDTTTLAVALKSVGYETALTGKWHWDRSLNGDLRSMDLTIPTAHWLAASPRSHTSTRPVISPGRGTAMAS